LGSTVAAAVRVTTCSAAAAAAVALAVQATPTCAAAEWGVTGLDKGPARVFVVITVRPCALPGGVRHRQSDDILEALWGLRWGGGVDGGRLWKVLSSNKEAAQIAKTDPIFQAKA